MGHDPPIVTNPMLLLQNADVYAPEPRGRQDLLVGGGRILWMGPTGTRATLAAALGADAAVRVARDLVDRRSQLR